MICCGFPPAGECVAWNGLGTPGGHTVHWMQHWAEAKFFDFASLLLGRIPLIHPFFIELEAANWRRGQDKRPVSQFPGLLNCWQHRASFLLFVAAFSPLVGARAVSVSRRTVRLQGVFPPTCAQNGRMCSRMLGLTASSSFPDGFPTFPNAAAWLGIHRILYSSLNCSSSALGHILQSD